MTHITECVGRPRDAARPQPEKGRAGSVAIRTGLPEPRHVALPKDLSATIELHGVPRYAIPGSDEPRRPQRIQPNSPVRRRRRRSSVLDRFAYPPAAEHAIVADQSSATSGKIPKNELRLPTWHRPRSRDENQLPDG